MNEIIGLINLIIFLIKFFYDFQHAANCGKLVVMYKRLGYEYKRNMSFEKVINEVIKHAINENEIKILERYKKQRKLPFIWFVIWILTSIVSLYLLANNII